MEFPVAIPASSVLAALAAGSAVIIKPAPQAARCGAVLVEALLSAGVPADALQLVNVSEGSLGRQLVADPRVGRLILTGAFDTATLFRQFRRDLPLLAETSGKNAIVVTPSADIDLAVRDVVRSAFGPPGRSARPPRWRSWWGRSLPPRGSGISWWTRSRRSRWRGPLTLTARWVR